MSPRVEIVVLNWNSRDDLLHCLATLPRLRYENFGVTVVDNASTDGSVEALRARFPEQRLLVNDTNLGFCGGNNRAIADALERGADYVLLLNTDVEVHADLVTELVRIAADDAAIGAVGAKNLRLGDPGTVWGAWNVLAYESELVRVAGQGEPDGEAWSQVREVEAVVGNGMLMARAALEAVGGFDEAFFAYHEDVDWCLRARAAGFRVVYCGAAIVYHKGFGTSDPNRPVPAPLLYLLSRNGIYFARKHASAAKQARYAALFLASVFRRMVQARRRGERVKPYLWMLRGFADGLVGRLPLKALKLQ